MTFHPVCPAFKETRFNFEIWIVLEGSPSTQDECPFAVEPNKSRQFFRASISPPPEFRDPNALPWLALLGLDPCEMQFKPRWAAKGAVASEVWRRRKVATSHVRGLSHPWRIISSQQAALTPAKAQLPRIRDPTVLHIVPTNLFLSRWMNMNFASVNREGQRFSTIKFSVQDIDLG